MVALDVNFTTGVHCFAVASQLKTHGFNTEYKTEREQNTSLDLITTIQVVTSNNMLSNTHVQP